MTSMKPMSEAPLDRPILIRLHENCGDRRDQFEVAQYAEWDGGVGYYGRVWEIGPGECLNWENPDIVGWYELPA